MQIIPILVGTHAMKETPEGMDIFEHTSAVTLIENEGKYMLVDTGSRGKFEEIKTKLTALGVTIANIDYIVLTHFHPDHSYNAPFFPQAHLVGWTHEWKAGATFRYNNIENMEFIKGVKIIRTPGHAEEHLSVIVTRDDGKKVVISGDAINNKYVETGKIHAMFYDEDLYRQSADKIMEIADMIIPGHGEQITLKGHALKHLPLRTTHT